MKMKNVFSLKSLSVATVLGITLLYSCKKDNEDSLSSTDSKNVNSESVSASSTSETADMTASVMNYFNDTKLNSNTRTAGFIEGVLIDARLKGATVTIVRNGNSTFDIPQGTITIDFGNGTTDNYGIVRTGQIVITYYGRRYKVDSYRTIHFSGYSRTVSATSSNKISVDNATVYTVTNVTSDSTATVLKFHHVLENATLTFSSDGSTIVRNHNIVVAWDRNASTLTHLAKTIDVLHSASGTTRNGTCYTMDITKDLVHKLSCLPNVYIPVSGTKSFKVGCNATVNYTIDYGDNTCDNTATITIGGKTITITVRGDGN